jgi:hypothetical protein
MKKILVIEDNTEIRENTVENAGVEIITKFLVQKMGI